MTKLSNSKSGNSLLKTTTNSTRNPLQIGKNSGQRKLKNSAGTKNGIKYWTIATSPFINGTPEAKPI